MKLISEVQTTSMQEIVLLPEQGTSSLFGDFAFAQLFHPRALTTQQRLPIQKSTDPIGALDEGWSTTLRRKYAHAYTQEDKNESLIHSSSSPVKNFVTSFDSTTNKEL